MLEKEKRMTVAELQLLISKYLDSGEIVPESPVLWFADEFSEYGFFESPKLWDTHSFAHRIIPFRYDKELEDVNDFIQYHKDKLQESPQSEFRLKRIEELKDKKKELEQFKGGLVLGTL